MVRNIIIALLLLCVAGVYSLYLDALKPRDPTIAYSRSDTAMPHCTNAKHEPLTITPVEHKNAIAQPIKSPLSPLIRDVDDKTVAYDFDEISKLPPEYYNYILLAECARISLSLPAGTEQGRHEIDCTAIKRLRDERNYGRAQVDAIAAYAMKDETIAPDIIARRVDNFYACFDTPKQATNAAN